MFTRTLDEVWQTINVCKEGKMKGKEKLFVSDSTVNSLSGGWHRIVSVNKHGLLLRLVHLVMDETVIKEYNCAPSSSKQSHKPWPFEQSITHRFNDTQYRVSDIHTLRMWGTSVYNPTGSISIPSAVLRYWVSQLESHYNCEQTRISEGKLATPDYYFDFELKYPMKVPIMYALERQQHAATIQRNPFRYLACSSL
eukprot:CFRG7415T1